MGTYWLDEVAFLAVSLTASNDSGALGLSALDVVHDPVVLRLRDLGTLVGQGVEWVSNTQLGSGLNEEVGEFVVNPLLDVDTGSGATGLTVVEADY
jgi:hypothetical protein